MKWLLFSCVFSYFIIDNVTEGVELTQEILDKEVGPVVFVNMLFRHGERNPLHPCPSDPYRDPKYWPEGFGQLTNRGKLHHYQLGMWLRERYLHLIPNGKYHYDVIKVLSTDMDRTLMSAQANLAGMFPLQKDEKWSELNWQPIPVHAVPKQFDKVLAVGVPCRKYDRIRRSFKNSKEFQKIQAKYGKILNYCSRYSGKKCSLGTIYELNSDLLIEQMRNFSLPHWAKKIYPKYTAEASGVQIALSTWTTEMKRLRGGPLVKNMMENLLRKAGNQTNNGVSRQTIAMFSAHDSTVGHLLNTLGVYNFLPPPFHSLVLVELRRSRDDQHYVTVLYKNTTNPMGEPHLLTLPGCTKACPLKKMMNLLDPVIPRDWSRECRDEHPAEQAGLKTNEV